MLRVARRHVVFLEPNDSFAMRALAALGMSFPFEIPAVRANGGTSGGVRNSGVPNFIYRWSGHEARKAVAAALPEFACALDARPFWDFTIDEHELGLRRETRIGALTRVLGTRNLIRLLKASEKLLNVTPPIRRQGNKFCCIVSKRDELRPWLKRERGEIVFAGSEAA